MAKRCLHCDKKIGFFKTPIEGIYCTYDCRNAAREAQLKLEDEARDRARGRELQAELEAQERLQSQVVAKDQASRRSVCPKCASPWHCVEGGGAGGSDRGECTYCGFNAEFISIEECPNCRCVSLVVRSPEEARCPKCKTHARHQRRIA